VCERDAVIVVVATTADQADAVRGRLAELDAQVVESEAHGVVVAGAEDEWRLVEQLREEGWLAVVRPDGGPQLEAWKQHTRPLGFGDRLTVSFAWSEHDRTNLPGVVELGAGGFGSGEHPATRLVIESLVGRIVGGERVLDVGCGSGVLGLCALRLGAANVVAVDIKPDAIAATRRNAALNGMESRVDASTSSLADIDQSFDVVVANIGRSVIVDLAPLLVQRVAANGWLAVSGISTPQCAQVVEFLHPLVEVERRTDGEWSSVVVGHSTLAAAS